MNIPESLIIGHRTYVVVVDDKVVDEAQPDGLEWNAFSDPRRQVIGVRAESGPDDERDSVLHEVLHQCLRAAGSWPDQVRPTPEMNREEIVIAAMTGPLLQALRDNPDLVAYLLWRPEPTPG